MKKKMLFVGLAAVGLLGLLAATAGAKEAEQKPKPEPGPTPDADEVELKDNETMVIPPGPEGLPDGSSVPVIVRDEDENESGETPPPAAPPLEQIPSEEEIIAVANETGQKPETVVDAIVKETLPSPPEPLATAETAPQADPNGTVSLARLLLTRENMPGWKEDLQPSVADWQKVVGLKPDGKFGVLSAARMAEEVGILPLVRFWSAGKHWNKATATQDYQTTIRGVIAELEEGRPETAAHIAALQQSMSREQAQALAKNPPAQKTEAWAQQAIEAATASTVKDYTS